VEWLDIYDENFEPVGVKERQAVHRDGDWHRTFHGWIVRSDGRLLFQLRSATKADYPNRFDVTAAGHYAAGETGLAGLREVSEELGIQVDPDQLAYGGIRVRVRRQSGLIDREFSEVYFIRDDRPWSHYHPARQEVDGLLAITIEDGLALFSDRLTAIHGLYFDAVTGRVDRRRVLRAEFLETRDPYFLMVTIMADRFLKGQPIAI